MTLLYCPLCGSYLEGGDGEMQDCLCGWKQPNILKEPDISNITLEDILESLEQSNKEYAEYLKTRTPKQAAQDYKNYWDMLNPILEEQHKVWEEQTKNMQITDELWNRRFTI